MKAATIARDFKNRKTFVFCTREHNARIMLGRLLLEGSGQLFAPDGVITPLKASVAFPKTDCSNCRLKPQPDISKSNETFYA